MSDGPGNRKSGTSYEETAAFSTMREERGFNPRVILKSGFHGLQSGLGIAHGPNTIF